MLRRARTLRSPVITSTSRSASSWAALSMLTLPVTT
jgi:hypothetical protein